MNNMYNHLSNEIESHNIRVRKNRGHNVLIAAIIIVTAGFLVYNLVSIAIGFVTLYY